MILAIEIDIDHPAFEDDLSADVAGVLRRLADTLELSPGGETCVGELAMSFNTIDLRVEPWRERVGFCRCRS